jgi:hypothetical protein
VSLCSQYSCFDIFQTVLASDPFPLFLVGSMLLAEEFYRFGVNISAQLECVGSHSICHRIALGAAADVQLDGMLAL